MEHTRGRRGGPDGGLRAAWAGIGQGSWLAFDAVELIRVELPFRRPVTTATATFTSRPLVLVRVQAGTGPTAVEGWGECAALAEAGYVAEDAEAAFAALERVLGPALVEAARVDGGRLLPPGDLGSLSHAAPRSPMAFAALEMAVADAHLRAEGRSLAAVLGVEGRPVEVGAVVGTFASTDALVEEVRNLAGSGYRRVKMKIGPGWDVGPVEAVVGSFSALDLQVDANGSYTEADTDHLRGLDRFGLLCLEQPFGREELAAHARLAARLKTPVCLDESLDSPARVAGALRSGACSVVCVKPARLGGVGAALEVIEECVRTGVPMWMGGMFESGYARGVNTTLAALPGFAWPGDLSPARSYLADDVLADPGSSPSPRGSPRPAATRGPTATPPHHSGMGAAPDPRFLERYLVRRVTLSASMA